MTMLDVIGGKSACDVASNVDIANVEDGYELTVTLPAVTTPGQYALSEIGAVASIRINDSNCAAAHSDSTTAGTITSRATTRNSMRS